MYRILDWLQLPSPRLVVTAISNTMDLPERLLPRVASRCGICRVDFAPYQRDQIARALTELLKSHSATDAFNPVALQLCAARVAAGSGDIRKALQVCRRTVEIRLNLPEVGPVDVPHIQKAFKDLLSENPVANAIRGLSVRARRLLLAWVLSAGDEDVVPMSKVISKYAKLLSALQVETGQHKGSADMDGVCSAAAGEAMYLAQRLEAMSLLNLHERHNVFGLRVSLGAGLDVEDLRGALKDTEDDYAVCQLIGDGD